jgi:hypothetical protein
VGLFVVFVVVSYDFSKFRFRRILVKRIYWSRAKCMNGGYGHADVKEWSYKGLLFRNWRSYLWFCYRSPWLYLPPPILSGLQVLLVSVTATVDIVVCFFGFYCCMAVQGPSVQGPSVAIFGLHGCRGSAATLINGQLGSAAAVAARTLLVNRRLRGCSDSARTLKMSS